MKKFLIFISLLFAMQFAYAVEINSSTELPNQELKNSQIEFEKLQQKANLGNVIAQFKLGLTYQEKLQYQLANQWFEEASKNNMGYATYILALNYFSGKGAIIDKKKAFELANKSYQQGFLKANHLLSFLVVFK